MSAYRFVVKPNTVHTSGIIIDQNRRVVQPGPGDDALGDTVENEEIFQLSEGRYTYRFSSYGNESDFTIKIVELATGRTIDGPEPHKSPRIHDLFTFKV